MDTLEKLYEKLIQILWELYFRLPFPEFLDQERWGAGEDIPGTVLAFFSRHVESLRALFAQAEYGKRCVDDLTGHLIRSILAYNQFLELPAETRAEIQALFANQWWQIEDLLNGDTAPPLLEKKFSVLLGEYYSRLRVITLLLQETYRIDGGDDSFVNYMMVNREYSLTLQLQILGIELDELRNPVLDMGCGTGGVMVNYLAKKGFDVRGFDLGIEGSEEEGLVHAGDWFQFAFEPDHWGSIISQMAFSNHFLFNHLYKNGRPAEYASLYMKILGALRVGGAFYYAPGLPFIEDYLPGDRFDVQRRKPEYDFSAGDEPNFAEFSRNYLYSSKITRMA